MLANLKESGVEDILIACIDGLKGFPKAINAIFSKTEIQFIFALTRREILHYTPNPQLNPLCCKQTSKGAFTSENALLKLVFCAYKKALAKWTQPIHNWARIVSQLDIHFPNRLELKIN